MALFTKENAASFGSIGGKMAGRAKSQAETKRLEEIALANLTAGYEGKTLARVRLQLDLTFEAFMLEASKQTCDASKLDRLASAQARLHEQERQLSNRPLPGTLRPVQGKTKRQEPTSEPRPACASDTPTGSVPVQPPDPITPQA